MVKKKRQSEPSENGDESTESCDESVKSACPHVAKAVDLTKLKRTLRNDGFAKECVECKKNAGAETNGVSDPDYEEDLSLWMCLRCGTQLCGRARNKHALNHYNTPHSDCHALTTNTSSWEVHCYNCNNEVTVTSAKKLHECVEYLKKQSNTSIKPLNPIELPYKPLDDNVIKTEPASKGKDKASAMNFPRVKGLTNLGNTCFFNSVMQCLVQTPYLLNVLQEMASPGEKFTLPGGKLKLKGEGDDDGKEVELPPISGELAEWGTLTRTLAETLQELQTGDGGVFTPNKLLSALVNKLPQFGGCDQHDAHELMRHLLEAVRSEDLRRYQQIILVRLGMSQKVDPARVDEKMKQKVKFYGQQASDTMLRPEQVFRGALVSTLECQQCYHTSDRAESFLDLSLPVAASRPQPPALRTRKSNNEDPTFSTQEEKPSKHQLKKERIAAAKKARKNKAAKTEDGTDQPNSADAKSSSESDADVEDNLEETSRPPAAPPAQAHTAANFAAYHLESGYNSEKVISSDSIRTSPVDLQEKADNTPERDDKSLLKNLSNPDSGVASPDATKHNSTETVDNVDSPIGPKELGSGSSLDEPTVSVEPDRPPSRADFPIYNNEVVSRGISARAGRSLAGRSNSPPPSPPELAARLAGVALAPPRAPAPPTTSFSPRFFPDEEECSVQSCLAQFTALELLTGNNKVSCETCTKRAGEKTVYTNATKRFLVSSPPAVLILHLKRFQLGPRCMFRKISRHVDFTTVLDLAPFCAIEKIKHRGPLLYSLYGVVEHSGGMHGGHYVAYVKVRTGAKTPSFLPAAVAPQQEIDSDASGNSGYESGDAPTTPEVTPPSGKWYYVSDSMVSEASEEKVLRAQAYLLFYERIL